MPHIKQFLLELTGHESSPCNFHLIGIIKAIKTVKLILFSKEFIIKYLFYRLIEILIKNMPQVSIFLTGYNSQNIAISKQQKILGWVRKKKELEIGSYVFVYRWTNSTQL